MARRAAAAREAWHDELSVEGRLTLRGFVGMKARMVFLGGVDHLRVRNAVRTELDEAGLEPPRPSVGERVAREFVGRRPRKPDDEHVQRLDGLQPPAPNPQPAVDAGNSESPRAAAGLANRDRDDQTTHRPDPEVAGTERRAPALAAAAPQRSTPDEPWAPPPDPASLARRAHTRAAADNTPETHRPARRSSAAAAPRPPACEGCSTQTLQPAPLVRVTNAGSGDVTDR